MTDNDSRPLLSRRIVLAMMAASAGGLTTAEDVMNSTLSTDGSDAVYAQNYAGADLSAKLSNALGSLPSTNSTVRVTSKPDGSAWQWRSDLTLDLIERQGTALLVDDDVVIEYTGNGTMLTVDNTPSVTGAHPGQESRLTLRGGLWRATGQNPDCWLRIKDSIGCEIHPNEVRGFSNAAGDATALSVENHASYSENTHVSGRFSSVDRGIDFVPVSETGGNGSNSFHDTYLENVHINAHNFCLRLRGNFDYSLLAKPSLFAKADGATCLMLDTVRADGTVIVAIKCESPGDFADTTAVLQTAAYDQSYAPLFVGGRLDGFGIDRILQTESDESPFLGQLRMRDKAIEFINWGTDSAAEVTQNGGFSVDGDLRLAGSGVSATGQSLEFNTSNGTYLNLDRDEFVDISKPYRPPMENLATYGDPGQDRVYVHHTGQDGNPEGLYFSDADGQQWVELAGSAMISF